MKRLFLAAALVSTLVPFAAHAAFSFTEIMYDASGTDTKHEWVEVLNEGAPVDISGFKFFENGTNHGLTLVQGSPSIGTNGYAIIADDAVTFLADYPSFSGTLFDSAFSLSNTGETVELRDESLTVRASASYTSELGAAGDGNSLNNLSGTWYPRLPTPGAEAASGSSAPTSTSTEQVSTTSETETVTTPSGSAGPEEKPKVTVRAGDDRVVVVGAGVQFSATAYGLTGDPLLTARYVWNFGNAATKEGKSVMYAYTIPGTYTVTVEAFSGGYSAVDKVLVTVVPADIVVTRANADFIEIHNRTNRELDLSLWQLGVAGTFFVLPPHTVIGGNKALAIPFDASNLAPSSPADVTLYYPNGVQAATAAPELTFVGPGVTSQPKAVTQATKSKPEPRVLGAKTSALEERGTQVAAAIESTSPEWAWFSFLFLGLIVLLGLGALAYVQFKK